MPRQTSTISSKRLPSILNRQPRLLTLLVLNVNSSHVLLLPLAILPPPAPLLVLQRPRWPLKATGVPQLRRIVLLHLPHRGVSQITSRIPSLMVFLRRSISG